MLKINKDEKVSVENQGKVARLLKKFDSKQSSTLTSQPQDLIYAARLIEHVERLKETGGHLAKYYQPGPLSIEHYPRHRLFFEATKNYKECAFFGANRIGKTEGTGGYATTCFATGEYPDWWPGRVFEKATSGWVCGDTNETVRNILQDKLLGKPHGTGLIAEKSLLDVIIRPNTGGTVDRIYVKHVTGKTSTIQFKTYQQGVESFYGTAKDFIWLDEEPGGKDAQLIWNQCYMRLLTTDGTLMITFTPLLGWTPLVKTYSETADDLTPIDD